MKTLELKENQVVYDVETRQALARQDSILLTENGKRVAALVPIEDYDEYMAWREAQQDEIPANWADERTLEEVVADIKRRGPGIPAYREATASLKDLLENSPHDPDFDQEEWTREWEKIEAEMKERAKRDMEKTLAEIQASLEQKV